MKIMIILLTAVFTTVLLKAQSPVPVGDEPQHHVVFQNEYVRVIDVVFPPGYVTLFHTHSADNVAVTIEGGKIRTEFPGNEPTESEQRVGQVSLFRASYTHRITNMSATTVHFIDAEILSTPAAVTRASKTAESPGGTLENENDRVRIYRLTLAPGKSTGSITHAKGWLEVTVHGGRITRSSGPDRQTAQVEPGEFRWHAPATVLTITNAGHSTYEAIEIEWK